MTQVMVPSQLNLDWTFLTTSLGWVGAYVCTVMCFCWISQRSRCGIYAGWCHGCPRYQIELFPSSSSLCCCVPGRLYTCTGPMTAADVSSWWAARGEEALVIHVPGPHNSVPVCSSRADLPCPQSVPSLKVLLERSTRGGCLCICLTLLSIANPGWQFSTSLIQASGLSTMPCEFMFCKAYESPWFQ